jgi:hypothetical protein
MVYKIPAAEKRVIFDFTLLGIAVIFAGIAILCVSFLGTGRRV